MNCRIPTWPIASRDGVLLGRAWREAAEALLKMADKYPLVALVGRAGMGKSQVSWYICKKLNCIYIDGTELPDRSTVGLVATVAWRILNRVDTRIKHRLTVAYRKYGYFGISSLAQGDPAWTLKSALELVQGKIYVVLDELIPSTDDPKFFDVALALHRIRNMRLENASFITTFLPEVYEKLAEKITPLGDVLSLSTVQLPDVISREDLEELVEYYCPEKGEIANTLLSEKPDMTIRELLIYLYRNPSYIELSIE